MSSCFEVEWDRAERATAALHQAEKDISTLRGTLMYVLKYCDIDEYARGAIEKALEETK